jgi:hypothetical protein
VKGALAGGIFPGEESILTAADLTGAGLGIASGWVDHDQASGGIGLGSNVLSGGVQAWNIGKGIGKVAYAHRGAYQQTAAGKKVARNMKTEGALDIVGNTLDLGNTLGSTTVNATKVAGGNDTAETAGGVTSGAFGIASGLFGGGKSLFDLGSSIKSRYDAKKFTNNADADVAAIANIHKKQQDTKARDAGIGFGKSIGNIIGGAGSIVGALGSTTAGNVLYSVGTGMSMLGSIGQVVNKGSAPKDTEKAAKGLAAKISRGDPEADRYAQRLGIDPNQVRNDPYLAQLITTKMGG